MAELADKQLKTLKKLIESAETNLLGAKELLVSLVGETPAGPKVAEAPPTGKVIEGAFDGQNMHGPDSKVYPVPANYASKSKLVSGDVLKLTIADDGTFIYKQIGPIDRKKMIGTLTLKDSQYFVEAEGKSYHVLFASVTYFKAQPGQQLTIVVPKDHESEWAAIEAAIA